MRDIRDPQEVGELVIELVHRSERNISATAAADKVEGYILKNYGESNEDYIARCNLIAATKRNGTSG